ncbi:PLP-dependent aminotransferase family protein [Tomitella biformata]|uniref:aminotransferase-like domain-containing protein n=1 Tax=Tomitella biformata TaxID=630403 RepID=UPI000467779D|nr:PLP-dependent aminotransferase family protein [Tomitella biformata]
MTSPALPQTSTRFDTVASSPVRDLLALTEIPDLISFAGGLPAPELFDIAAIRAAFAAALADPETLQYSATEGLLALRQRIADRYARQGLPTTPEQIIVTTGSQQALHLAATALISPGDVVLVEEPSYLAAIQAFEIAGARVIAVPAGPAGFDADAVEHLAREHRPVLFYTVPTFQNPSGRSLNVASRRALAALAATHGFRVLEDDPYRELRYSGGELPHIASLAAPGQVLTTGSLSKIVAPGLRLGWIRTDPSTHPVLTVAKQAADLHTSTVNQAAAAHYLASGRLDGALDRQRAAYQDRRDAMLDALPSVLPAGSEWTRPDGGMFVWARLPAQYDTTSLLPLAIERQVAFVPGAPFYPQEPDLSTMRLSFTTHAPGVIRTGLERLRLALADAGQS